MIGYIVSYQNFGNTYYVSNLGDNSGNSNKSLAQKFKSRKEAEAAVSAYALRGSNRSHFDILEVKQEEVWVITGKLKHLSDIRKYYVGVLKDGTPSGWDTAKNDKVLKFTTMWEAYDYFPKLKTIHDKDDWFNFRVEKVSL